MRLNSGEVFAGYTIQRLLGSGGMGEVYLAQHPRLPRLDALKILPANLTGDSAFRQRFLREADLAATLWHPHIVGVHDRGEHGGQLWISMDFVDGTDAAKLLGGTERPGLSLDLVLDIADAVSDALDLAHQRGLLHRDVKPSNILLTTPTSIRQRILLADFGIARHTNDTHGLTETNMTVGTLSFAAPEQLLGQALSGAADQYALAASVYTLLCGSPPFADSNPAVVISKHLSTPAPPLSATRADLAALDAVITRAMAKQPADRFSRCVDFSNALRAAAQPPASGPIPPPGPAGPLAHTQLAPASPAAAPTVAAVAVTDDAPTQLRSAPEAADPPEFDNASGSRRTRLRAVLGPVLLGLLVLIACAVAVAGSNVNRDREQAVPEWQPFIDTAKQTAVNLTSIDYRTVDSDVQRIIDTSTGGFLDDFNQRAKSFADTVRQVQSVATGTADEAALESIKGDTATVIVAVTVTTTVKAESQPQEPKNWRMRIEVQRDSATYKASGLEFVP